MFDLATVPQPLTGANQVGVPLDWRLARPTLPVDYPYTDLVTRSGVAEPGVETLATYSMQLEDTLATAIVLSLFTDARAGRDDWLPRGSDRRGWVGDEFVAAEGDQWGSRLWLLLVSKVQGSVLEAAKVAAIDALQWLVRDGIAQRVDATALWVGERLDRLAVRPQVWQPGEASPVYDVLWGTTLRRGAQEA